MEDGKMKRKFFAILVAALVVFVGALTVYTASSQTYNSPELSITFLNQDPDPAEPGNFFKARLKIENIGLGEARNLELEILPEYPFSIYQDSTVKKVASISPRQKESEAVYAEYSLKIDGSAIPGTHEIKMNHRTDHCSRHRLRHKISKGFFFSKIALPNERL